MKSKNILITVVVLVIGVILLAVTLPKDTLQAKMENKQLNVVTTVAPITNIVYNIGGTKINLHGLIPEGTDSHTFEPAPSDAVALSDADIIIVNGLHLETPTEKLAESTKKKDAVIFRLADKTIQENEWIFDFSFPKEGGDPNPHLWMNPQYAKKYAELVRDLLMKRDPKNASYYQSNAQKYIAKLDRLDKAIEDSVATVPEQNRKLLTYHDSWAYFARRYGMKIVGAIQPSDFKEPNPKEVAVLIDQLKQEKIPAVFSSEVFPSKVLDKIAKAANVKWVATLRDDNLPGAKNAKEHTYIGMMLEDMGHMIVPLGGNVDALQSIDPANLIQ